LKVFKRLTPFVIVVLSVLLFSSVVHAGSAPDFTFTDIDGNTHSLSSFLGSVVILEFFEIECPYCANEIGMLKTVYNTFGSGLVIISASITDVDTNDKLQQYRYNNSIPWIVTGAVPGLWYGLYTAPSVPALFIIDQSGNLMYQNDWTNTTSQLIEEVQGLGPTLTVDSACSVVGQGRRLQINLTIGNSEGSTEVFNMTAYANSATIGTQLLPPAGGNSATVALTWDTTGVAYGNYTITASATPVSDETKTVGDDAFGGWVLVTIPGDINGDFKVNLLDLVALARAYGSKPDSPNWNPNADIDGIGVVGLADLVTLAQHYGQHYP
jgi:thiol-disulfide isomerase/thioredoxin